MKRILKKALGFPSILKLLSLVGKRKIAIITYHGFIHPDERVGLGRLYTYKHLPINLFEQQLRFIVDYCHPVSLQTALSGLPLPKRPVVLTFDDGYHNNFSLAFPLLQRYRVPATVFVTTGFVDQSHALWTDRIEYLILRASHSKAEITCDGKALQLAMQTDLEKISTLAKVKCLLKTIPERQKESFLNTLEEILHLHYHWGNMPNSARPLSWDEIRRMHQSGLVTIGSHTVSHPILSRCDRTQQLEELRLSRMRIEDELDEACLLFAYPNGETTDYSPETITLLQEAGYTSALTMIYGLVDPIEHDNYQLPRCGTQTRFDDFKMVVTGVSALTSRVHLIVDEIYRRLATKTD